MTNLNIRISPGYNVKRIRNTLECCADYLDGKLSKDDAWLLDDVRDALARLTPDAAVSRLEEFRNFIEEIAGSCIPDYEEAKAEAQQLLSIDRESAK